MMFKSIPCHPYMLRLVFKKKAYIFGVENVGDLDIPPRLYIDA